MKKRKYYYLVETTSLESNMTIYTRVATTEERAKEFLAMLFRAYTASGEKIVDTLDYDFFDCHGFRYHISSAIAI